MRRLLIVLCLIVLIVAAVGVGLLAADWPFWQRAWAWQTAAAGRPPALPGARRMLAGTPAVPPPAASAPAPLTATAIAALTSLARQQPTAALLVAQRGALLFESYGPSIDAASLLDGADLSSAWLAPLFGIASANRPGLLDEPVGDYLPEWRGDPRGQITPRQLFWHVSGLAVPDFVPLNPFSDRARLASGPNFVRAALAFPAELPPGGFFRHSPADMQLLALVLQRATGSDVADYLEAGLWIPLGAGPAQVLLDRRGGTIAAHCCFAAAARDWLRLAQLLADGGVAGGRRLLPEEFVTQIARQSPVHPGAGLGLTVEAGPGGSQLLVMQGEGRWLIAAPERGVAVMWFSSTSALSQEARHAVLTALGL
ncbi:MAG: serine hydrolase domain-containing protein [Pseudomonadota bacterium]